jgi:hypothetical protein
LSLRFQVLFLFNPFSSKKSLSLKRKRRFLEGVFFGEEEELLFIER